MIRKVDTKPAVPILKPAGSRGDRCRQITGGPENLELILPRRVDPATPQARPGEIGIIGQPLRQASGPAAGR